MLRSWIRITVGLLFPLLSWAGEQPPAAVDTAALLRDDYIRASLLIAEPSHEVYSLFGHCALRLECPSAQMDYCFTFETSTDTKGILDFVRGTARGGFMASQTDHYLSVYQAAGRGVTQYELNLTPEEKLRLWKIVDDELSSGFLRHYDYLHTHCTSMIVALVQQALREPIIYNDLPAELRGSFRDVLFTTSHYPWSTFFWQTVMGPAADATEPLEHKFVPVLLPEVWRLAGIIRPTPPTAHPQQTNPSNESKKNTLFFFPRTLGRGERVKSEESRFARSEESRSARSEESKEASSLDSKSHSSLFILHSSLSPLSLGEGSGVRLSFPTPSLFFSLLLLLTVGITMGQHYAGWHRLPRILDITLLTVHLLISMALLWLVTCSRLEGTQWNWYLLAFNPLPEMAGVLTHRWNTVGRCTLWLLLLVLLLTPCIPQLDFPHALFIGSFAIRLAAVSFIIKTHQ